MIPYKETLRPAAKSCTMTAWMDFSCRANTLSTDLLLLLNFILEGLKFKTSCPPICPSLLVPNSSSSPSHIAVHSSSSPSHETVHSLPCTSSRFNCLKSEKKKKQQLFLGLSRFGGTGPLKSCPESGQCISTCNNSLYLKQERKMENIIFLQRCIQYVANCCDMYVKLNLLYFFKNQKAQNWIDVSWNWCEK